MNERHIPSQALERMLTNAEGAMDDPPVAAHLRTCTLCSGRLRGLQRENQRFYEMHPEGVFLANLSARQSSKPRNRAATWAIVFAAAPAMALMLWVFTRVPSATDRLIARGTATMTLFRVDLQAGGLRPLVEPSVTEDTIVRVRFQLPEPAFLCVYHQGTDAKLQLLHSAASIVPPGPWFMPGTFELTESRGVERIIATMHSGVVDCERSMTVLDRVLTDGGLPVNMTSTPRSVSPLEWMSLDLPRRETR